MNGVVKYMYDNIPDNYDLFEQHETEMERLHRLRKRRAEAYGTVEMEDYEDEFI